jgi:alpha-L-rhamnosidase
MMKKLVGYYLSKSKNYIADVNTYGDWLQPFPQKVGNNKGDTPTDLIGTAYFAHSVNLTLKAAIELGNEKDKAELKALHDSVCNAFVKKYLDNDGRLKTKYETQTGYLMALGFGIVSEDLGKKVLSYLIRQIEKSDYHLGTGFLGTPLLGPVLDRYGHTDIMYKILLQRTYPSWFYSIAQVATTIWERWNSFSVEKGFGNASMNSFNHYAYGAIGQWMYEHIAGISALEPGYKKILIAPVPNDSLTFVKGEHNSVYGKIVSEWKKKNDGFQFYISIPVNTTAKVIKPIEKEMYLSLNGDLISDCKDIIAMNRSDHYAIVEITSGIYNFKTHRNNRE